jgi:hypothetical protein
LLRLIHLLQCVVANRTVGEFLVATEQEWICGTRDRGSHQRGQPEQPELGLAGLTDVLEIGIEMRWISVSASPIAKPAKPFGALSSVAPRMTSRKTPVSTSSAINTATIE